MTGDNSGDAKDNSEQASVVVFADAAERAAGKTISQIEEILEHSSRRKFDDRLAECYRKLAASGPPLESVVAGKLRISLEDIDRARLPENYRAARRALRACWEIDECAGLAKKAEAIATYARCAKDNELRVLADRIQARAIRRCGELLAEFKAARGRRTDLQLRDGNGPKLLTRSQAATQAGLSERQRKTALRIAAIPTAEFERAVESSNPPTVTALAARGKRRSTREPASRDESYWLMVKYCRNPAWDLAQVAIEQELAVLQAAWREASPTAQRRFLQNLGIAVHPFADNGAPLVPE